MLGVRLIFHRALAVVAMLLLFGFSGCQTWDTQGKIPTFPGSKKEKKKEAKPEKIVAVWTEATHHQPGKPAERGFGGRIVFYNSQDKPMEIDGRVTVFVFDDQHPTEDNPAPKYKFVFPADTVPSHYSKSELGHSYSFWIPLANIDSPSVPFSLVVRYDGPQGERVLSDLTKKVLVGTGIKVAKKGNQEPRRLNSVERSSIQQVSFDQPLASDKFSGNKGQIHGQVETIPVSPSFARRLESGKESPTSKPTDNPSFASKNRWADLSQSAATTGSGNSSMAAANGSLENPQENSSAEKPAQATSTNQLQSGFVLRQSQAPLRSGFQPTGAAPRRAPHPGGWQLGLPPTPRTGFGSKPQTSDPTMSELADRAHRWFEQANQSQSTTEGASSN